MRPFFLKQFLVYVMYWIIRQRFDLINLLDTQKRDNSVVVFSRVIDLFVQNLQFLTISWYITHMLVSAAFQSP